MVQVLSCHHFKSQTVVSPSHEPLVVFAAGQYLFIATLQQTIEIYRLDGAKSTLINTLKTVGLVSKGTFNAPGNYIATLEKEDGNDVHLRVYFNWSQQGGEGNVTKARIAGSAQSPVKSARPRPKSQGLCLEVVEVQTKRPVECVGCCSHNGNLVAGMEGMVSIFQLVGGGGGRKFPSHDFHHFMDIVIDGFQVINADIHGAHLAITSAQEAHVLLINGQKFRISCPPLHDAALASSNSDPSTPVKSSQSHAPTTVLESARSDEGDTAVHEDTCFVHDAHFVDWKLGSQGKTRASFDPSDNIARNQIVLQSIQDEDCKKQKDGPAEVLGPVSSIAGIAPFRVRHGEKTKSGKRSQAEKVPSYIHLLYCRFPSNGASLTTAQLMPTYSNASASSSSPSSSSELTRNRTLLGMCCLLSTPKQGLVYDIMGQVRPLSSYLYTGEAISLQAGEDFLYAVSSSGLETYSHRVAAAAIHRTETFDDKANACPDPTTDICLVGLRPFLSVQMVVSCDNHVILMCKALSGEDNLDSDWSVYVLQKAPVADIHADMIEMAASFRQASPTAYQHVVTEAHLMARAKLLQCCGHSNGGNNDGGSNVDGGASQGGDMDDCPEMASLYRETSALLGNIYARSTSAEWPLTLPYLRMCEKSLKEILESLTGPVDQPYIAEDMTLGPGFASFLDFRLSEEEFENQEIDEAIAERIIDVYCHLNPSRCSELFLSRKFKGHLSSQKKLDILQDLKKQSQNSYEWSNNDNIAMIMINLELGEIEQAKFATSCLTPDEVIHLIPDYADLILNEDKQLTDFARLLCKESTDSMVAVLLGLLGNELMTLKQATTVLKALHARASGNCPLLTRLVESVMCDANWQHLFPDAMQEIVPIYLSQLLQSDEPSMMSSSRACRRTHAHVPQGDGCFAGRFNWLNNVPPFQGSLRQTCTGLEQKARSWRLQRGRSGSVTQPQTPTKTGGQCPCCCCNEVLMRLQSLLCSGHLTEEVATYVIEETEDMKEGRGRGSLQLLCQTRLDPKSALSLVIREYPSIAVDFSSQHCGHNEELWSHVLADLVRGLEEKTTDGMETRKAVSLQMLSGVLGYLVQEVDAYTLLQLLPSDLPLALTMPYMERSLLRNRAKTLQQDIIATGLENIGDN